MTLTGTVPAQARSLHDICEAAQLVNCGHCWAGPAEPCAPGGTRLARFARARCRGLLTEPEMAAVIDAAGAFTLATIVPDGAR